MSEQGESPDAPPKTSMPAPEPVPSTSKSISNLTRIQRNVAEKQRRDKLNGYISELANIVPMVSMSSKRLDKTSILRLSAAHLRLSKSPLSGSKNMKRSFKWCPNFLTSEQVREILESVDGFLIVTSSIGKILFTSASVERYLGHQNIDMIGHSLFLFIHPDDVDSVKEEIEKLFTTSLKCGDSGRTPRCSFRCRMKEKGQPRSEVITYQSVHIAGDMTISNDEEGTNKNSKSTAVVTHIFKAFVRVVDSNPYNQLSIEEATADEYITRHSLDGTIIFADHRLSTITGHLPREVMGLSAYEYIVPDDISVALFAHHLMFSSDKGTGMIVYRLRTSDDKHVYLKSAGCLQFDRATSQVDHFVCVNQHLSEAEGETQLKYFVDRFIPHIKDSSTKSLLESVKALQAMGLKTPSSVGSLNESVTYNRLSTLENSKPPSTANTMVYNNAQNSTDLKSSTCIRRNVFPQAVNPAKSSSGSSSKSDKSLPSSPKRISVDKNIGTQTNLSSAPLDSQRKNKDFPYNTEDFLRRKRKAVCNNPVNTSLPNVLNSDDASNYSSAFSDRALVITHSKIAQSNDSSQKMYSSSGLHIASLPSQTISIKSDALNTINSVKSNAFSTDNKNMQYGNHSNDFYIGYHEVSKNYNHITKISKCIQMQPPAILAPNHTKDSSFQVLSLAGDSRFDENTLNKTYDDKVSIELEMPNIAGVYSLNTENYPDIKTNILLSSGSVLYNNDLQMKMQKVNVGNRELVSLENSPFVPNKIIHSDSNHLSVNVSDVVVQTAIWPGETSSESSTSNAVSDETFTSSMECPDDVHNMYFMPEEDMKACLAAPEDISSLLDSTLPFDDSSLPSVDGWSEYLKPGDILNPSNTEVSLNVEGEQSVVNTLAEKSFDLW